MATEAIDTNEEEELRKLLLMTREDERARIRRAIERQLFKTEITPNSSWNRAIKLCLTVIDKHQEPE